MSTYEKESAVVAPKKVVVTVKVSCTTYSTKEGLKIAQDVAEQVGRVKGIEAVRAVAVTK